MTIYPRVSVLMSVYNGACFLRDAINSVLHQTFGDFEFVIVDDSSTDATPVILESYTDPRIVRLRNETNIGLTRSLNKGLVVARGEYVARHDADDVSFPDRLASQVAYLDVHPQIALVGSAYREVYGDGRPDRSIRVPVAPDEIREQLLYHHCFCHGAILARRTALAGVGGYDECFVVAQDRDLWLRLADHYMLANLPDELYALRMSPNSVTGTLRTRQREAARLAVKRALARGMLKPTQQALGRFYWLQALDELSDGRSIWANAFLSQAVVANPLLADDAPWLSQAALHRAFELSRAIYRKAPEYDVGFKFLESLESLLPAHIVIPPAFQLWMSGELNAAYAFAAARVGDGRRTRRFCLSAWRSDKAHWRNRGLVSVFLRSFASRPATDAVSGAQCDCVL